MKESNTSEIIRFLALYGEKYRQTYLRHHKPERLLKDWWQAFKFFLGHAVNVGRCDEISERVCEQAVGALAPLFSGLDCQIVYTRNQNEGWLSSSEQLAMRIGPGRVGKRGDVLMVIAALDSLRDLPDLNVVRHTVNEIRCRKGAV